MRSPFVQRHQNKIEEGISCCDWIVVTGTLSDIGYAGTMATFLRA